MNQPTQSVHVRLINGKEMKLEKGSRVRIAAGTRGFGKTGTCFWFGADRYDPQMTRAGVECDDGESVFVDAAFLEVSDVPAPDPAAMPDPEVGSRVRWRKGQGVVFWFGPDKYGEGMRVGVKDDNGDTFWMNAAWVRVVEPGPRQTDIEDLMAS